MMGQGPAGWSVREAGRGNRRWLSRDTAKSAMGLEGASQGRVRHRRQGQGVAVSLERG